MWGSNFVKGIWGTIVLFMLMAFVLGCIVWAFIGSSGCIVEGDFVLVKYDPPAAQTVVEAIEPERTEVIVETADEIP